MRARARCRGIRRRGCTAEKAPHAHMRRGLIAYTVELPENSGFPHYVTARAPLGCVASGEERSGQQGCMAAKRLAKKKNRHEPCAKRPLKMLTLSSCSNNNSGGGRAPLQVCGVSGPSRREPCVSLSHFCAGLVAAARLRSRWDSRRLADCAVRPVVACRVCPLRRSRR